MVGVSAAAWERMKEVNYQGYDAILPFRTVRTDGRCPYTPNWHGWPRCTRGRRPSSRKAWTPRLPATKP